MGIGTSVLLKLNIEKVLKTMEITATVEAADVNSVRSLAKQAQIIVTTPELVQTLDGVQSEIISINHFFDLEEIRQKLSKALL